MIWLWTVLAGVVVGLLGKWLAPDDEDNIPLLLTVVLGVLGVLGGRLIATAVGVEDSTSGEVITWVMQICLAVILVVIASTVLKARAARRGRA